jgi:hypothetical protein
VDFLIWHTTPKRIGQLNAAPVFMPIFFSTTAAGQNPVKADCSKLAPTKAVKKSQ